MRQAIADLSVFDDHAPALLFFNTGSLCQRTPQYRDCDYYLTLRAHHLPDREAAVIVQVSLRVDAEMMSQHSSSEETGIHAPYLCMTPWQGGVAG